MKNSAKYRKPPIKRTRDSFVDDMNSTENPRVDFGQARHREIRRDKDKIKSFGITLYDIDFAIKSFVDQEMSLKVEDNGEYISVPTLYANSEKWASIQKNGFLKDKKGKTLVPLISFRRSGVSIKSELRRNKVAKTNQIAYIMRAQYNRQEPYDKFSTLYGTRKPFEYFATPVPDYVDVTYDFIVWCDYQQQLNHIIEQFVYFSGQSFGDKNFFKFSTNIDSISLEDNNTTGQDRVVRATFQIVVHAYLLPKDVAGEVTTKRLITPNKIQFTSEAFSDVNGTLGRLNVPKFGEAGSLYAGAGNTPGGIAGGIAGGVNGGGSNYEGLNNDPTLQNEELRRRLNNFTDTSLNKSPDVYPTELD